MDGYIESHGTFLDQIVDAYYTHSSRRSM
jgi:hypothetical protein